jgi:phage-related protein (TIGR01555 family)
METKNKVVKLLPGNNGITKARYDRWVNAINKFGGANDPITKTSFMRDYAIPRQELDYLYEGDWVTRKGIEIPAQDATRKFINIINDDPNVVDAVNDELERLKIRDKIEEAIILQRLYGGNAMIIGAFDGRPVDQPLGKVRSVDFFNNIDRFFAYPMTFYTDPTKNNFGDVELYQVQELKVAGARMLVVHESRVIRFDGNYLPPVLRVRNFGWGAPIIHNVFEALRQFGVAFQSGSSVLQDFVTKKMKIANLQDLLSNDVGEENLVNRLQLMAQELAVNNIAVYGSDEEFDKMGTPITGLDGLMDRFMEVASAAFNIPKSRFYSNMTGKLGGDTSEADLRIHYDNISSFQVTRLNSKVRKILDIITEPMGYAKGEIKFEWVPLWQLSELDQAKVRREVAESDKMYVDMGAVEPEEVAVSRFGGDQINVTNMVIDTKRRTDFLEQLSKQPIGGDEDELDDNGNQVPEDDPDGQEGVDE